MRLCLMCIILDTVCWFKMSATLRILVVSRPVFAEDNAIDEVDHHHGTLSTPFLDHDL